VTGSSISQKRVHVLIAWIVDHGFGDVLIHKNQQRQRKSQAHGGEGSGQGQFLETGSFYRQNLVVSKMVDWTCMMRSVRGEESAKSGDGRRGAALTRNIAKDV
jgi:hypothetical protein